MAVIYVDDLAGGLNDGTSWTDAYTSIDNVNVDGAAAGSDIWVANTHNESIAAPVTLNFTSSTLASPITVKSINTSTDAYTTGAKLTVTGAGNDISLTGPHFQIYGMVFDAIDLVLIANTTDATAHIEDCTFTAQRTSATTNTETYAKYVNCTFTSNTSTAGLNCVPVGAESRCEFVGCTMNHTTANNLTDVGDNSSVQFEDCVLTDATDICDGFGIARGPVDIVVRRCQMKASWTTLGAGSITAPGQFVLVESCTNSTGLTLPVIPLSKYDEYAGTVKDVLTPDRTGGGESQFNSIYSREMITNASALEQFIALRSLNLTRRVTTNTTPSGATSQGIFTSTRLGPNDNLTGTHTGGADAAVLTDSAATWATNSLVGKQIQNTTDSSEATITANTATTVTGTLSGGTDNNWDNADAYTLNLPLAPTSTWNGSGVGTEQLLATHTLSSQNGAVLTVFVASGGPLDYGDMWVEIHEPDQTGGTLVVEAFLAKPSTTVYVDVKLDVV